MASKVDWNLQAWQEIESRAGAYTLRQAKLLAEDLKRLGLDESRDGGDYHGGVTYQLLRDGGGKPFYIARIEAGSGPNEITKTSAPWWPGSIWFRPSALTGSEKSAAISKIQRQIEKRLEMPPTKDVFEKKTTKGGNPFYEMPLSDLLHCRGNHRLIMEMAQWLVGELKNLP
jgi:hypothetical protein